MTRWGLLLRAVNVGGHNRVPMGELRALLTDLGHADVRTFLNSGNATFGSARTDARELADEAEEGLRVRLGVDVRGTVVATERLHVMAQQVPAGLQGYVVVCVLFDAPEPDAVAALEGWEPETVRGGDGVLYVAYGTVQRSRLTTALIEKRLGVGATARTPATLLKMV